MIPETEPFAQCVENAVVESIESMAFAEVLYEGQETKPFSGDEEALLWGRIPILEPAKAILTLIIPSALAEELGEGVYGMLEELPDGIVQDFIAELTNTIAGQLMAEWTSGQLFELGLPQTGSGMPPAVDDPVAAHKV